MPPGSEAVARWRALGETPRASRGRVRVNRALEDPLWIRDVGKIGDDVEAGQLFRFQFGQALRDIEEALDLGGRQYTLGQGAELLDVLGAAEWMRAERMCIRDRDLVDQPSAIGQVDLDASAERFLLRIQRVVATRPVRIVGRRDLMPQLHGVR